MMPKLNETSFSGCCFRLENLRRSAKRLKAWQISISTYFDVVTWFQLGIPAWDRGMDSIIGPSMKFFTKEFRGDSLSQIYLCRKFEN